LFRNSFGNFVGINFNASGDLWWSSTEVTGMVVQWIRWNPHAHIMEESYRGNVRIGEQFVMRTLSQKQTSTYPWCYAAYCGNTAWGLPDNATKFSVVGDYPPVPRGFFRLNWNGQPFAHPEWKSTNQYFLEEVRGLAQGSDDSMIQEKLNLLETKNKAAWDAMQAPYLQVDTRLAPALIRSFAMENEALIDQALVETAPPTTQTTSATTTTATATETATPTPATGSTNTRTILYFAIPALAIASYVLFTKAA
jgi:hypothetical protein